MSALAHFIERSGVATATIALVREQAERVGPRRTLWVPFPLGRPLGAADDPEFQTNVLRAAFDLFDTVTEPAIVDYPLEAPGELNAQQWACPLNLSVPVDDSLESRFRAEVASLRPWFDITTDRRGHSTFGASGAAFSQVDVVVDALLSLASDGSFTELPVGAEWSHEMPLLSRHLAGDMRTLYQDAIAAQPGDGAPTHDALNDWIFGKTVLGEVLQTAATRAQGSENGLVKFMKFFMIPEGYH
ncbi:MAG: hypothetical protein ACI8Y4_000573 [Candidatus Poriferisodalaceae bacterium]